MSSNEVGISAVDWRATLDVVLRNVDSLDGTPFLRVDLESGKMVEQKMGTNGEISVAELTDGLYQWFRGDMLMSYWVEQVPHFRNSRKTVRIDESCSVSLTDWCLLLRRFTISRGKETLVSYTYLRRDSRPKSLILSFLNQDDWWDWEGIFELVDETINRRKKKTIGR